MGATKGSLSTCDLARTVVDRTLDGLPPTRAEEGVALTDTKGLERKVPTDAGAASMLEVPLGGWSLLWQVLIQRRALAIKCWFLFAQVRPSGRSFSMRWEFLTSVYTFWMEASAALTQAPLAASESTSS